MAVARTRIKALRVSGVKLFYSAITKQWYKTAKARDKAREKEKRKQKRQFKRAQFLITHPFQSDVTGRRYKTEKGMQRAERKYIADHWNELFDNPEDNDGIEPGVPELVIRAERHCPMDWLDLSSTKNAWSHFSGIIYEIFYDIQGGIWERLEEGSISVYYTRHGLESGDVHGNSLKDFINHVMGVYDDI